MNVRADPAYYLCNGEPPAQTTAIVVYGKLPRQFLLVTLDKGSALSLLAAFWGRHPTVIG